MKIKITEDGCLELERKGYMRLQHCPFYLNSVQVKCCGDWCPLFGEPVEENNSERSYLTICNNKTLCGEITDERT